MEYDDIGDDQEREIFQVNDPYLLHGIEFITLLRQRVQLGVALTPAGKPRLPISIMT